MPHWEEKISSETLFEGKVIRLTVDTVELENGNTSTREIVHHNGGAGIVALNEKGEVALVRQFRYAVGRELVEIPAGKVEPGENPLHTAQRELEEETGYKAAHFKEFGQALPTVGYCTETIYIYLAWGLTFTQQHLDADEFVDVFWLPLADAVRMVLDGQITDSKTVSGLLRAKLLQDEGKLPG